MAAIARLCVSLGQVRLMTMNNNINILSFIQWSVISCVWRYQKTSWGEELLRGFLYWNDLTFLCKYCILPSLLVASSGKGERKCKCRAWKLLHALFDFSKTPHGLRLEKPTNHGIRKGSGKDAESNLCAFFTF